ncbi:LuxR C-terminal-related transcriptional regulator [Acrocarpospora sp. B8E8]|uniref:response regulator transcription factor n=1 Tax=Acrocarpospora sp. B8E8 TaxID=3153572 RepID=UPI00325EAC1C
MLSPGNAALTGWEREILRLIAKGTSNRQVAVVLFISEAAVKSHLTHSYGKFGVKDRAAAVVAYERGILG